MSLGSQRSGDNTQPLSQSVYVAYQEENILEHLHQKSGHKPRSLLAKCTPASSGSSQEEIGRADVVALFERPIPVPKVDFQAQDVDEPFEPSQLEVHAELYPEDKRFRQPKTPATNGKKRDLHRDHKNGEWTTPSLPINPFANHNTADVGIMGLSQVFKATQAPSSPFTNILPSDETSERPSPAMHSLQRPSTATHLSSPSRLRRQIPQRSVTEPYNNYISLQESQEEREHRLVMQAVSLSPNMRQGVMENHDDEFAPEESQLRRRLHRKKFELEANQQFDTVKAKARLRSSDAIHGEEKRDKDGRRQELLPVARKTTQRIVLVSDNLQSDNFNDNASEEETEYEEDTNIPEMELPDELGEDDKENQDNRHVQVPATTSRTPKKTPITLTPRSSPLKQRLRPSQVHDELDELAADDDSVKILEGKDFESNASAAHVVAIADSQPSPFTEIHKPTRANHKRHQSLPMSSTESGACVPQSQMNHHPSTSQSDLLKVRQVINGSSSPLDSRLTPVHSRCSPRESQQSLSRLRNSLRQSRSYLGRPTSQIDSESAAQLGSSPPKMLDIVVTKSGQIGTDNSSRLPGGEHAPSAHCVSETERRNAYEVTSSSERNRSPFIQQSRIQPGFEHDPATLQKVNNLKSTIPETSSLPHASDPMVNTSYSQEASNSDATCMNNNLKGLDTIRKSEDQYDTSTGFVTAQSHLTPVETSVQLIQYSSDPHRSPGTTTSPIARTFADIGTVDSPRSTNGTDDIDVGIMTNEDIEFQLLMEGSSPIGPVRKRRRIYGEQPLSILGKRLAAATEVSASSLLGSVASSQTTASGNTRIIPAPGVAFAECGQTSHSLMGIEQDAIGGEFLEQPVAGSKSRRKTASMKSCSIQNYTKNLGEKGRTETSSYIEQVTEGLKPSTTKNDITSTIAMSEGVADDSILSSNRVLAFFNGTASAYYPATCVGVVGEDAPKFQIRFDDGTTDVVNPINVKRLELHKGDIVKLDRRGSRSKNYIIVGLSSKQSRSGFDVHKNPASGPYTRQPPNPSLPLTDVHGHLSVSVILKQRQSAAQGKFEGIEEVVPLAIIYLTSTLFKLLKDRVYSYRPSLSASGSGLHTPSDQPSTPSTPSSRNRRLKTSATSAPSICVPTSLPRQTSHLFDNLLFGITNIDNLHLRAETIQQIRSNGGEFLDSAFDELFHVPEVASASSGDDNRSAAGTKFCLKPVYSSLGFTCLITDRYCRNQKFFQALALGIPCLATRWIKDCIRKQEVLPWEPYLLPSGESSYLNAVRTRLLPSYSTSSAQLSTIISYRPAFLAGASIILVTGKGKEEQLMKAYPFIAYALGARKVAIAVNFDAARQLMLEAEDGDEAWDWVCYHDGDKIGDHLGSSQAEVTLFGESAEGGQRQRSIEVDLSKKPRVVVTEFVVQSLILGQLLDVD